VGKQSVKLSHGAFFVVVSKGELGSNQALKVLEGLFTELLAPQYVMIYL